MMAPTHLAAGAAAGLAVAQFYHVPPALCMALGALAGLLPDIDHPNGTIRQRLPGSNILLFWLRHRGLTHTAIAWAVFTATVSSVLFSYFGQSVEPVICALSFGYGIHLIGDMLTKRGIPYYGPFNWENISLLPIRAGGMVETLVIMPGLLLLIAFMLLGGR